MPFDRHQARSTDIQARAMMCTAAGECMLGFASAGPRSLKLSKRRTVRSSPTRDTIASWPIKRVADASCSADLQNACWLTIGVVLKPRRRPRLSLVYGSWCRNMAGACMAQPEIREDLLSVDALSVNDRTVYAVGRCIVTTVFLISGFATA